MYLSVFTKTFAGLAATALIAAQTLQWDEPQAIRSSAMVLGFSLLMALIGATIALLWAVLGQPATTVWGRAIRAGIQALLASPLAAIVLHNTSDFVEVEQMLLPTLSAVALAILIALAANYAPVPITDDPIVADTVGTT